MQAYNPPLSLWMLVEEQIPASEQDEIKSMLGSNLVDQSIELHSEVEMLLDIWRDMRDEAKESKSLQCQLPEPPNQRERLIQEINFFAESVKEKARQKGIDPTDIMKRHNKNVIDYASDASRPGSSMSISSISSDGRETPMMVASPDRISRAFEVTDKVEAVNKHLNVDKFEEVSAHLRLTLENGIDQLFGDIEFLQGCLDNEADIRDSIDTPRISREPTLTELREERASLEKELLLSDNLTYTPQVDKPLFNDNFKKPLPATSVQQVASLSNTSSRQSPMKANHSLNLQNNPEKRIQSISTGKLSSRGGGDFPLRAVHDIQLTKTQKEIQSSNNLSPRQTQIPSGGSSSFLPNPPKGPPSTENSRVNFSKTSNESIPVSSDNLTNTPSRENVSDSKPNRGRRTVSPGRVRVVNLNSIVGMHSGKRDHNTSESEHLNDLNVSNPLLPFSPMPPSTAAPNVETSLRPTSADRFRKMVMGCRDGE